MNTAVLTGASGFLGSHIAEKLLKTGIPTKVLLRQSSSTANIPKDCQISRVDFMNTNSISESLENAQIIIHSAGATSAASLEEFDRVNALITKKLLIARENACKNALFIYISSQAAAGPSSKGPVTDYGRSKLLGEFAVRESDNWVIIRPPAIFGSRDPASTPILKWALRGIFVSPWKNKGGFSLVYAPDLAELIADLPNHPDAIGNILEPSYGKIFSWKDFHQLLQEASQKKILHLRIPPILVHAAGFMSEALATFSSKAPFFSSDKVKELLATDWDLEEGLTNQLTGWHPSTPSVQAMRQTFDWIRNKSE